MMGVLLAHGSHGALPDLAIYYPAITPHIVYRNFEANACEVQEGCVQPGVRRLLLFALQTRNIGTADLIMGNPATNSAFYFDACHGHYHYEGFAEYRLRDTNSNVVLLGHKIGFCLEDVVRWSATAGQNSRYDCNYQGIQAGWADVYTEDVPCQWLDITGLPGGTYTLELEVNPSRAIQEASYANNLSRKTITIESDCSPMLANDSFSSAQSLPVSPWSLETYNSCATKEAGEPNHAGNAGGHSLWFRYTAVSNGPIRLSTQGSDFNTLLAIYTGSSVTSLSPVTSNDDLSVTNQQSAVSFNGVAGTVYSIAADGWNGAYGKLVLNLNPPLNDQFANCQTLSGISGRVTGHNVGATREPNESDHNSSFSWRSVWYCWTAPTNGPVIFDTEGSDFDTLLAVYTGSSVGALTPVASDNDSGGNLTSRVLFKAVQGTAYHIAVDGTQGGSGNITLNWNPPCHLVLQKASPTTVRLILTGEQGTYEIQGATNLTNWVVITNLTLSGSQQSFLDSNPGSVARKFYRARALP
jgi:Lysyl oxidase